MEQQQNSKKRRLMEQNKISTKSVDQSTMTDCGLPMSLTVWTQTEFEENKSPISSAVEIELREKISKMEEKLKNHTLLLNELTSHKNKNDLITKYKIVSEGSDIQLEPIMVECGGEEVIFYEETTATENNHISPVRYQTSSVQNHNSNNSKHETYSSHSNARVEFNNEKRCDVWNGEGHHNTPTTIVSSSATNTSNGSQTAPQNLCTNLRQTPISLNSSQSNNETGSMITQQSDGYQASNRVTRASILHHSQQYEPRDLSEVSNSPNIPLNHNINNVTSMTKFKSENNSPMNFYTPDNSNGSFNTKSSIKNTSSSSSPNYTMNSQEYISIGPNQTRIPSHIFESIDWNSTATATRKLLTATFDRMTLATHSLTGKPSPAFHDRDRPLKKQLDPNIISDIIFAVSRRCNVAEREVRSAITTKCADENKMLRQRERRQKRDIDKENIVVT